jgi:hypothetical protein
MELTTLLERMKMDHLLAQLDGVCEHAAKGDLDYSSNTIRRNSRLKTNTQKIPNRPSNSMASISVGMLSV